MKLYTDNIQTTQLIKLRYAKPKSIVDFGLDKTGRIYQDMAYSIDELFKMLPNNLVMQGEKDKWSVSIGNVTIVKAELIDALFELLTH